MHRAHLFNLSDIFLSDSGPFLEDSVSTISFAKPFTVLSVSSDEEIASNYHNSRFPCLTSSNFLSFLILSFLTVSQSLIFSTSLHSHFLLFTNSQLCLSIYSHLLKFLSLNTNFYPAQSDNLQQNSQTTQCFPVQLPTKSTNQPFQVLLVACVIFFFFYFD